MSCCLRTFCRKGLPHEHVDSFMPDALQRHRDSETQMFSLASREACPSVFSQRAQVDWQVFKMVTFLVRARQGSSGLGFFEVSSQCWSGNTFIRPLLSGPIQTRTPAVPSEHQPRTCHFSSFPQRHAFVTPDTGVLRLF